MNERTRQVNDILQSAEELTSMSYTLADYDGDVEAYIDDAVEMCPLELDEHDEELFRERVREIITR